MSYFGSHAHKAFRSIVESVLHSHMKLNAKAVEHYHDARTHAHNHRTEVPHEAAEFDADIGPLFREAEGMIKIHSPHALGGAASHEAQHTPVDPKAPAAQPKAQVAAPKAGGIINRVKKLFKSEDTKQKGNRTPGRAKGHQYISFKNLHPDDQRVAIKSFQAKEMTQHQYPVGKDGRLAVGVSRQRTTAVPKADESFVKPHKNGTGVYIHSEGHEHHGAFGVVVSDSPYYPGKVGVQIRPKGQATQTVYVEPHEVTRQKLTKSDSSEVLIEKAKATHKGLKRNTRK